MKKFDVIIIGAGPSGVSCAMNSLNLGLSVCLVDKSVFPRNKLCAGILTNKTEQVLVNSGFSTNYKSISTNNVNLNLENHTIPLKLKHSLKFVERSIFDDDLLIQCQLKGANLFLGVYVQHFGLDKNTLTLSNHENVNYRYLIIADGVNSKTRKILSQPKLKKYLCLQTHISNHQMEQYSLNQVDLSLRFIRGFTGYQWFVPNENGIILGTALYQVKTPYSSLEEIHKTTCSRLSNNQNVTMRGGYVSTGEVVNCNYKLSNNIVFIGESSGMICPITGEGIYYALKSGQIVAQSIKDSTITNTSLLDNYTSNIQEYYSRISIDKAILNKLYTVLVSNYGLIHLKSETQYLSSLIDDTVSTANSNFAEKYEEICYLLR